MDHEHKIWIHRKSINNATKSDKPHVSHRFKIVWIKEGRALWNIAGDSCTISKNDVVLLNNEEKRRFEQILSRENLEFFVMEFEPQFLFDSGLLLLFTEQVNGYAHRIIASDPDLDHILAQIYREDMNKESYSQTVIASCVIQLLALAARKIALPSGPRPRVNPLMKTVLTYIDEHFTRRITLNELADMAHMSSTAFSRYFTKYNGVGPAQYIKRKRIGLAIRLLEETDRTILDIGMDCGFQNMSNFYKAFHSLTGQAPGNYRTVMEE
ncbi:MAG: AraC-type DNA-binding protein [Paenibacillaceae bacterium]|jgi:AraC-like DNA-binding protein|nr:AraC-type DNA-binding protein [Paenibacillaceae bacterium]